MRSRGAAAISSVTLRQVSAVLPPERAWGLWASRRIVSGVMDTLGPSLAGTQVEHVDVRMPGGGRLIGEWVLAAGVRREDRALRRELNRALSRNREGIATILASYHVPILRDTPMAPAPPP
jgi:hypothetical protein